MLAKCAGLAGGADDRDAVGGFGKIDLPSLDQERSPLEPLEADATAARPGGTAGWDGLERPLAQQGVERFERGISVRPRHTLRQDNLTPPSGVSVQCGLWAISHGCPSGSMKIAE